VHRAAFGGGFEADLVRRLRSDGLVAASLVAIAAGAVVGHVLFSDLEVEVDGRLVDAVSLAPLAVLPAWQRQGVGSRLVRAGLAALRGSRSAAIVVGHPDYYPRFGFSAARVRHLDTPYPGDAFMGLEIERGALAGRRGRVRYPAAFGGE
jgi:putative acetyltransferase